MNREEWIESAIARNDGSGYGSSKIAGDGRGWLSSQEGCGEGAGFGYYYTQDGFGNGSTTENGRRMDEQLNFFYGDKNGHYGMD